jgi:N-dimethylarginine dimethylaminohydrolase
MKPDKILMCEPKYFDITYFGNDFMKGNINNLDKIKAVKEWYDLKSVYENLGFKVSLIPAVEGQVDMVFTANQSLPLIDRYGEKIVFMSKMKNKERQNEVKYFEDFYKQNGYKIIHLPDIITHFESMGDCAIDYERKILFGGYGYRTQSEVYDFIADYVDFKIHRIHLQNPVLYHLDTCFSIINLHTAVIDKSAFTDADIEMFKIYFEDIIYADAEENMQYFVCNCHSPDGKNVIVQKGSKKFKEEILKRGLNLKEVDTSEFIKSGGSVFCMKMMFY